VNETSHIRSSADGELEAAIQARGRAIFDIMGNVQPPPYEARYWSNLLMGLSMRYPEFKVNLFRLVDVLPTLPSSAAIAEHVREYLGPTLERIHPALAWALGLTRNRLLAGLTAACVKAGVHQMSTMFIAGRSPSAALEILKRLRQQGFAFTVDLLGEFCVCEKEALEYQARYLEALDVFGKLIPPGSPLVAGHPGESSPLCISVKLSALYSQTGVLNSGRSVEILSERLAQIIRRAKLYNALVYVDAEDSGNNPIIYESFKRVFSDSEFINFPLPGIVIQAYSREAERVVDEMLSFARKRASPIAVRLVKGAYWDFERVVCAQNDWQFPLWTKKESSDAMYERLSRKLLENHSLCLPAFGSHNVRSLAHACCYAEHLGLSKRDFEIQVLYGMAEPIAAAFREQGHLVRMYVPLGEILPGMGYLVRRLLENTSNESFLRHTFFEEENCERLLQRPTMHRADEPIPSTSPTNQPLVTAS
jgi:RHH-type proline utilization regulon transcriptional repressor/proline dehydrogenase/delta 1-pyrroline-5-carboxylate dehydrogenase